MDKDCKGYSYFSFDEKCDMYTTGNCPNMPKTCSVVHDGKVGRIQHTNRNTDKGCFIKQPGENLHNGTKTDLLS